MIRHIRVNMLWAVEFDDESAREANEINYVRTNGGLAAEFVALKLLCAKKPPKMFFGIRSLISQRPSEVALLWVAIHGVQRNQN
jgi:hypothetical protein